MIFASDLDQTLIYSQPLERVTELGNLIVPSELIDGRVKSYMSLRSYQMLQKLMTELLFIPVTTRTLDQYARVHLFSQMLKPAYAVTSNGGNIIVQGKPDLDWHASILARRSESSVPAQDVENIMGRVLSPEWVIGSRYCDELFFSHVVDRAKMPLQDVVDMGKELQKMGWNTSIQGRKVYIVPHAVNKRDAVAHIKQLTGEQKVVASGDSLLDQVLLDFADYAIAPRHGELFRQEQLHPTFMYTFTDASGIFATDEIMAYVQERQSDISKFLLIKEPS
ncbi:HAD family hydrolase [Paenibacillus sp. N3.4]|uniref:HAD family hydrolase n=1 Tax=Paenibacillus sp. N3.4 TaxID=2603222 RepID=UPI0011CAE0DB|nr:HAD family hydrolase [Paenibacillus sp. N3.4]TXK84796.1 hydrolase [Paenibacillus sp. N3.4]